MDDADTAEGTSFGLTFTTSAIAEPITRGPANVAGDYLEVHHPALKLPPRQPPPSTTNSKKRKKSAAFTVSDEASPAAATATPAPKRTRALTKKNVPGRVIPQSFEECSPPDKLLITLRDKGEDWKSIREKYTEMTGEIIAPSTLPNRYNRLKTSFTHIKASDNALLLLAKRQVETSFEAQKWELVAQVLKQKGGEVYAGTVLQRQYKKLMLEHGELATGPPPGVRDADWEVDALP